MLQETEPPGPAGSEVGALTVGGRILDYTTFAARSWEGIAFRQLASFSLRGVLDLLQCDSPFAGIG
jgi:hypothetical protein